MLNKTKLVELEKIREANGGLLTRPAVEKAARDPRHPFHSQFEWDDSIAGYEYRLIQAGELIRSVTVVRIEEERTFQTVFYVHDPRQGTHEAGSVPLTELQRNQADAHDCLDYELSRIEGAIIRARGMAAVLGLESYFEEMLKQIALIRRRKRAA
jgi:hypothetical protein